jgi:hypothetical protein
MDHPFESLGEHRFQEFCQSLLIREFPDLQSFPIGQPDGGRDAILRRPDAQGDLVFQVKFSRSARRLDDPEAWARKILREELPKIEGLMERGVTEYKLLTNRPGTAHLDRGSIDRVQAVLDELPIKAECWWRDDLNRRLEAAFDLKGQYVELLVGPDHLRLLAEGAGSTEEGQRRERNVKAYLHQQFDDDRDVRFRQVDVADDLFKFYVDAPSERPNAAPPHNRRQGAASYFLSRAVSRSPHPAVLEGEPGQGKSTMLQYVCQIHRSKILGLPISPPYEDHLDYPTRLPFKIELRDFARWRSEDVPDGSLEEYLAGSIREASGRSRFDVADVHAIVGDTSVLLALDGLDEIGGEEARRGVVAEIEACARRLDDLSTSLQVVVTSRPPSFAGTVRLSDAKFETLKLRPLGRGLSFQYAEKWMDARGTSRRERLRLVEVLDDKLDEAHIQELARNPMQLAILLDAIVRGGSVLPEQRNALYSDYMKVFLDREAEKSSAVRRWRALLLDLHGYIAWLIHSSVDAGENSYISAEEVRSHTAEFLVGRGHDPELFDDLFAGAIDRVGALVSRRQDEFEFDVQGLREYFAANHLFETAASSVAGSVQPGTRPARFDAVAKRPFWLNVVRFYAGSYDVGELASLVERLEVLYSDPDLGPTPHPRAVVLSLLADRTFEQDLRIQARAVALLAAEMPERAVLGAGGESRTRSVLSLARDCGGEQIGGGAWEKLGAEARVDRRQLLASVILEQMPRKEDRAVRWLEGPGEEATPVERCRWIRSAHDLRIGDVLTAVPDGGSSRGEVVGSMLWGGQLSAFDGNEELAREAMIAVASGPPLALPEGSWDHPLAALDAVLATDALLDSGLTNRKLKKLAAAAASKVPAYAELGGLIGAMVASAESPGWAKRLDNWCDLVARCVEVVGEQDRVIDLAAVSAGFAVGPSPAADGELFDASIPLPRRAYYARRHGGYKRWWLDRLRTADSASERFLALALAWSWATEATLTEAKDELLRLHAELSSAEKGRLVELVARRHGRAKDVRIKRSRWLEGSDATMFLCAARRLTGIGALQTYRRAMPGERGSPPVVLEELNRFEAAALQKDAGRWPTTQRVFQRREGIGFAVAPGSRRRVDLGWATMPGDIAAEVLGAAGTYPLEAVAAAEERQMVDASQGLDDIRELSRRERWFAPS